MSKYVTIIIVSFANMMEGSLKEHDNCLVSVKAFNLLDAIPNPFVIWTGVLYEYKHREAHTARGECCMVHPSSALLILIQHMYCPLHSVQLARLMFKICKAKVVV